MPPSRPMKMPKSVIDLIWPADLVAPLEAVGEVFPRIGLALLHAQGDAAALFVDIQHHDFDFVANVHHLGRVTFLLVQSISDT